MGSVNPAEADILEHFADVSQDMIKGTDALPVIYSSRYNTSFFGLEKLHPFDSCKFQKVYRSLKNRSLIKKVWQPSRQVNQHRVLATCKALHVLPVTSRRVPRPAQSTTAQVLAGPCSLACRTRHAVMLLTCLYSSKTQA